MQEISVGKYTILYQRRKWQDKCLYLTFDDGPNPCVTYHILDVLDKYEVKAAFFLVGTNIKKFPAVVSEIYKRGHIIGNHSFNHSAFFAFRSAEIQKQQAQRVENLLQILGIEPCIYFRPPNAICSKTSLGVLRRYKIVGVNHWIFDNMVFSSRLIASLLLSSVKMRGSGILVLHDGVNPLFFSTRKAIPKALKIFLPEILSQGYHFHRLDEMAFPEAMG